MNKNMEKVENELAGNRRLFDAIYEIYRVTATLQGIAMVLCDGIAGGLYERSWTVKRSISNLMCSVVQAMDSGSEIERITKELEDIKKCIDCITNTLQCEKNAFDDYALNAEMNPANTMIKQGLVAANHEAKNLLSAFRVLEYEVNKYLDDCRNDCSFGSGDLYGRIVTRTRGQ